jgi:hypothetical protein
VQAVHKDGGFLIRQEEQEEHAFDQCDPADKRYYGAEGAAGPHIVVQDDRQSGAESENAA